MPVPSSFYQQFFFIVDIFFVDIEADLSLACTLPVSDIVKTHSQQTSRYMQGNL